MPPVDLLIVIPFYNEERHLKNTVAELIKSLPDTERLHIVLVDSGSTDQSARIAQECAEQYDRVTLTQSHVSLNPSAARNSGVAFGPSASFLAFIDADILVTDSWVSALMDLISEQNKADSLFITGDSVDVSIKPSPLELAWFRPLQSAKKSYVNSGNLITTSRTFELINGFNELLTSGEDSDFCRRAKSQGANLIFDARYRVHHEGFPHSPTQFFKRELWHGSGDFQSLATALRSKTLIFSVASSLTSVFALLSLLNGHIGLTLAFFSLDVLLTITFTYSKFRQRTIDQFLRKCLYAKLYLLARSVAFIRR